MAAPTDPLPSPPPALKLKPFTEKEFKRADSLYKTYRAYMEHEDELINQRSTWHLLIQGFLFATFAALGQWQPSPDHYLFDHRFLIVGIIALMGLLIAVCAYFSVDAADQALSSLRGRWTGAKKAACIPTSLDDAFPPLAGGGSDHALKWGKLPALVVPIIVAIAWVILLGLDCYVGGTQSQISSATPVTPIRSTVAAPPSEQHAEVAVQPCTCVPAKTTPKHPTKGPLP